ncbi:MAG: O-fucosyltransferase family protein [Mangrovibacterium sp.]
MSFKETRRAIIAKVAHHQVKNSYPNKQLIFSLRGGLCNKLLCLFSACDIALKHHIYLVEPEFGWHKKIAFSDIYDIDYFNNEMRKHFGGENLMISRSKVSSKKLCNLLNFKVRHNILNLWTYSETIVKAERKTATLHANSTKMKVLKALKLRSEYETIVNTYLTENLGAAIQVRTESDWQKYANDRKLADVNDRIFVGLDELLNMLHEVVSPGHLFFTSGQNHAEITEQLKLRNYSSDFFYDPALEYEINAAINFEICSRAKLFIGNSHSTFSNLISLKRALFFEHDESYIYNYGGKIYRRIDMGVQVDGHDSVMKRTHVISS